MYRYALGAILGIALWQLAACSDRAAPAPHQLAAEPAPPDPLARIVQQYWDAYLKLNPLRATAAGEHRYDDRLGDPIAPQYLADSLALERDFLAAALSLDPPADPDRRLTWELFKRRRELAIEGFTFPTELMPVNPFEAMPLEFATLAEGAGAQRFATAKDYADWLGRVDDYTVWTRQAVANLRDGVRRGYVLPRELVEEEIAQLQALSLDRPDNPFHGPERAMPQTLSSAARAELGATLDAAVQHKVLPALRELRDYLKTEYLPAARGSGSLADLPLGEAWYAHLVRLDTGTPLSPADIHRMGLAHIERLHARMTALLSEAGFAGNAQSFFDSMRREPRCASATVADLQGAYRDVQEKVAATVTIVLASPPQVPVEVRATEVFRAATDPAVRYQGIYGGIYRGTDPAGGARSILFVNGYDLSAGPACAAPANFLSAGVPGQHAQFVAQREQTDLPKFRRFGTDPGFVDGWGLYAASFGEDLGLYQDPAVRFAALSLQLRAAAALVVDTGLHSRRWSRRQAIEFLQSAVPLPLHEAELIVDRALALPGRQLAAGVGAEQFFALRDRVRAALGTKFDLGAFHREILAQGPMPFDLLQRHLEQWITRVTTEPAAAPDAPDVPDAPAALDAPAAPDAPTDAASGPASAATP
jgi:uncharacterized protein (DUF885 family)